MRFMINQSIFKFNILVRHCGYNQVLELEVCSTKIRTNRHIMARAEPRNSEPPIRTEHAKKNTDILPIGTTGIDATKCLDNPGNLRPFVYWDHPLLNDSGVSEKQKLRYVVDWAENLLKNSSEVDHSKASSSAVAMGKQVVPRNMSSAYYEPSPSRKLKLLTSPPTQGSRSGQIIERAQETSIDFVQTLPRINYKTSDETNTLSVFKSVECSEDSRSDIRETTAHKDIRFKEIRYLSAQNSFPPRDFHTFDQRHCTTIHDRTDCHCEENHCVECSNDTRFMNESVSSAAQNRTKNHPPFCSGSTTTGKPIIDCSPQNVYAKTQAAVLSSSWQPTHQKGLPQLEMKDNVKSRTEVEDEKVVCEQKPEVKTLQDWSKQQICDSWYEDPPKTSSYKELEESKPNTETANLTFCSASERAADVSVYEQYLLYMAHLDQLRQGQRARRSGNHGTETDNVKDGETVGQTTSPASCCEMTPSSSTQRFKLQQRREAARTSTATEPMMASNNAADITHNPNTPKATAKQSANVIMKRQRTTRSNHLALCEEVIKIPVEHGTSTDDDITGLPLHHLKINQEPESAGSSQHPLITPLNPENRTGNADGQSGAARRPDVPQRFWEKSSLCWSTLIHGEVLPRSPIPTRCWSAGEKRIPSKTNSTTKRQTQTQTPDTCTNITTPAGGHPHVESQASSNAATSVELGPNLVTKYRPADVAVFNQWLCLPDEVWLSVLSLLPHNHLSTVAQVCHRMHQLANDHTLWTVVERRNGALTEQWLSWLGVRRPHSVSLYRCSSPSISPRALETFFSLCTASLEKFNVTSCIGPGLHGNLLLRLIGQSCKRLTNLNLSWSGATDAGLTSLIENATGLRLEVVVLNGCQVTNEALINLVKTHRESLSTLEVFGCHFLSSSCLEKVYRLCPGLRHLNIGQVPKVNTRCLTLMTSQLKSLLSLNLTGLQAVSDGLMDRLLQQCPGLQSLSLASCPGVSDLTLNSICSHTPYIRSLDVSGCKAVTDAGVQCVALCCRGLQMVDLSSTSTGNRGLAVLADRCHEHLHTVKLSFCHISPENILRLCRHCKKLKVLHLYGCADIPSEREIREVHESVKVDPLP
ncbi:uncharacterized protein LOC115546096 isoform X2 [Gadus morhua]|uniref:uncharacterized protein LOC115546096 isoform X2 n=1 Tax=Gadus morhua TaxID=8049 RepID=UPI0011B6FACA|nr:uncharacterized protein LOC115546096 isoform X2 [Gadus morhua]